MFLIVLAIQVWLAHADWVMVDSSFWDASNYENNWNIYSDCLMSSLVFHNRYTCEQNSLQYDSLKKNFGLLKKDFGKKSYQTEMIVETFFDNAGCPSDKRAIFTLNLTQSPSSNQIMQQISYLNSDLTQNARIICNNTTPNYFDIKTVIGTSIVDYKEIFSISVCFEPEDDNQILGFRNMFVYVKYCLPTCKTCSSSTSCLTCYYGTTSPDGSCNCDPLHQFAETNIGCRQECKRDYFMARFDNICVPDRRIKSLIEYFTVETFSVTSPFQFVQDSTNLRISPQLIYTCVTTMYIGSLIYNEGMSLQFTTYQFLRFIRLRITFFVKNFLIDNRIQILLDDQIQGEIIKGSTDFSYNKVKKIYSSSSDCPTFDIIRIEAILRTYSVTPKLILKGAQLTQDASIWGFRNVTIEGGNCKENCIVCADFSTCQQCDTNYVLFQNGCVSSCPVHSENCIDYADMIPNSRYLAKGFYNKNMSTSDINTFFDETLPNTPDSNNFLTGQKFSIFPTKFVLGGVMVWNNAVYKKLWAILKPHYAVTIRFTVTYGDEYNGNFYYTIQGVKSIAYPKPLSGGQNFIGKSLNEITKYFEIFQNPFKSSTLNIEFQCTDTTADPRDQFCAISDYFIVVHYCLPFCEDCNDGGSCITWESGHTSPNCLSNQYLYLDPILETYSCITCNQPGCLTCKNLEECTSCDPSSLYDTLINGDCLQITALLPSEQCHKTCGTCIGTFKTDCKSCGSDFHRTLSKKQCLCQPGFYDDGINVFCIPICGDLLIVDGEDCDDGNYNPYDGCDNCKFNCDETCKVCILGICLDCQIGFQFVDNQCVAICGDNLLVKTEECEDVNQNPNDGCYNCKFSCLNHCIKCQFDKCLKCDESNGWYLMNNTCQPICGDDIELVAKNLQSYDVFDYGCLNYQIECENECINCYKGQCYKCEEIGWEIDLVSRVCKSNCGDGIIIGQEECDDGNEIEYDGCHQCKFQCSQYCIKCTFGSCQECSKGWHLDENNCISFCGDNIVAENEECDDGNIIPYDGCLECKYQCQSECSDCRAGICEQCREEGWYLINHYCETICGDGIVVKDVEECDDGNFKSNDGCYQCQFQCTEMCTLCEQGICYECDYVGWMIDNHICKPICGDGIITGSEQCDDMNGNSNDGCHQCQFACGQYCIDCQQGICQKCELGRLLVQNICVSQCGDGSYVKSVEYCDDNNQENGDGCDQNCKIEANYVCQNREGGFTQCAYSKQPSFYIKLLSNYAGNIQEVQVTFDQKMKYNGGDDQDNLSSLVITSIIEMSNFQYNIGLEIIKSQPINDISDITILLKVNFQASVERPTFKISFLNDSFFSEQNLPLQELSKTISLQTPSILSQSQINLAKSAVTYNEAVIYSLISLSGICLITGSPELFWNLMDQLQYLSYIKYVNIRFPPNLDIYFEVFKLISIQPAIQALRINNLLNLIQQGDNSQIYIADKFVIDDISIRFLDNFSSSIFCLITAYLGYIFFKTTYLILYNLQPWLLQKMSLKIAKAFYVFRKKCFKSSQDFYYNGLLRIVMSNSYDVSFAITLQLAYFQSNNITESINSYFSLIVFISYLGISIYIFNILQKFSSQNTLKVRKQYESLFEGIQDRKYPWISQYNTILLIKKLIFISLIVFMQTDGKLQILLIATNQTLFLSYLFLNNPLQNRYEYYKIIITESFIIFNTITFILYDYSQVFRLTQNFNVNLGWVHISTFSAILIFSLIIDIIQQANVMIIKLKQLFCQQKKQEDLGSAATPFL